METMNRCVNAFPTCNKLLEETFSYRGHV